MTSWPGFGVARARASWGLLLTLLTLATVTTAIIAGTVGYSQAAATAAARGALTQGEPTQTGVQLQTRLAEDPSAQDALAREAIARAFAPAPVSIGRLVVSEPRPALAEGTRLAGRVVLMGGPDLVAGAEGLSDLVEVVDGAWPEDGSGGDGGGDGTSAGAAQGDADNSTGGDGASDGAAEGDADTSDAAAPGALHAGAAQVWGVQVGDVMVVDDHAVEVVATWLPVDAQEAFWFGEELVHSGQVEADHGPLVVAEDLVQQVGAPFVRWPVRPDATEISPDDLAVLASGAERLRGDVRAVEGVNVRGVTIEGDLAPTAATAATNLATARALGVVPLSVLVLVTGLAVVQLARLLASTREPQVQLLVARGASRGQVLTAGLVEGALVALLGAVLGGALAWGVVRLVPGGDLVTRSVLTVAALTLVGIVLVLAAVTTLQARRLAGGQAIADRSGRARAATALATVVLVLGAAALAWWQLRRAGSPLVTREDGTLGTDLVAGAAPALLLAAAAVVALALLGPLTRVVELATRPARTAPGHLASAQVSRRLKVYAVPVVLTVLAVGATTLAALYAGSSTRLREDLTAVGEGAPVRADVVEPITRTEPGALPPAPPELADVPEVADAAQVWLEPDARVGDVTVPLTLASTSQLRAVTPQVDGVSLVPEGLDQLVDEVGEPVPSTSVEIPVGTQEVVVDLTVVSGTDRWELARLDGLAETQWDYERQLEEADLPRGAVDPGEELPEVPFEETMRLILGDEVARAVAPRPVEVSLLLRDTTTGMIMTLDAGEVQAQGPALGYDETTFTDVTSTPASTTARLPVTLSPGRAYALESLTLRFPRDLNEWSDHRRTVALDVAVTADGQDLLGGTPGWGSRQAATPEQAAPAREQAEAVSDPFLRVELRPWPDGSFSQSTETNQVHVPPTLDTSGAPWQLSGVLDLMPQEARGPFDLVLPEAVVVGPGLTYTGSTGGTIEEVASGLGGGQQPPVAAAPDVAVPAALTREAATAAALTVGDTFQIRYAGAELPARLTTLVTAVPGQTGSLAALVDSRVAARALAAEQRTLPWPSQVWATPSGSPDEAVAALARRPDLRAVTGPGAVSVADATSAARLVFWVASAGAVLLALTGIAAVAATLLSDRRPEVAVLRALGMPPAAQARSRALELGGVVIAAVVFGLGAGWLVGAGVVPELASSTTRAGGLTLPAGLHLEVAPWAMLVGVGAALVLGLTLVLASRVRSQALDRDYREEIR